MKTDMREKLEIAIARHAGAPGEVTGLAALSGGANNQTWRFSVAAGPAQGDYILRLAAIAGGESMPKEAEARIQQAAEAAGVPVAPVRWILEPGDGLGSGYIMTLVEGETIARKILRDDEYAEARPKLAAQCGRYAAMIHAVDAAAVPGIEENGLDTQLEFYKGIYRSTGLRRPVVELAFRWLEDHRPAPVEPHVVHGDFRNGNLIIGPEGVRAILDWELAHLGDPMEDLGWICVNSWRFGNRGQPVGGFGQREDMFAAYEKAAGSPVDATRVHYWEVMGTLKWGIMCMIMSRAEEAGKPLPVERAAIGRRTSETELDLLTLLAGER